jgi:T-complex protein 1 subunit gamma
VHLHTALSAASTRSRTALLLLLRIFLHATAGIVLTNDGHAILREIDVSHPAAKVRTSALQQ